MESLAYLHVAIARETNPAAGRDRVPQKAPKPKHSPIRLQAEQPFPCWSGLGF